MVIILVIIISLWGEIMSRLLKAILPLVILHSHIPWATIPLAVIVKLVVLMRWAVKGSILSKVLVEIIPWLVIPVVISISSIILAVRRWSVVAVLVSIIVGRAVLPSVPVCVILLSLLWLSSGGGGFFYC